MNEKWLFLKSFLLSKKINLLGNKRFPFAHILVVKLDEIGDMVTALHVFKMLKEEYPKSLITVWCKTFNAPFFRYMEDVSVVQNVNDLEGRNFDLIVDLRGSEESLKFARAHRPKYRLDRGTIRLKNKLFGGQKNELDTNLEIIQPLISSPHFDNSIAITTQERERVQSYLMHQNIDQFVILHVGARQEIKKWPVDRFASCINYINTRYELPCILVGSKEDIDANRECLSMVRSKSNYSVAGEFNLLEFTALCEKARLYIGNDSGPLHIAAACNIPVIAMYSNAVKNVWYPRGKKVKIHHYFLARNHTKQTVENSTIFQISVEEIQNSIDDLLQ